MEVFNIAEIILDSSKHGKPLVLVFLEGTILKPKSLLHHFNHKKYIPIGKSVSIINKWNNLGAEIVYCTSLRGKKLADMIFILEKYGFSGSKLYYRSGHESYSDLVEMIKPDYLIEDDCKSIGGQWQMCIAKVSQDTRKNIKHITVKEFKGIDHLVDLQIE